MTTFSQEHHSGSDAQSLLALGIRNVIEEFFNLFGLTSGKQELIEKIEKNHQTEIKTLKKMFDDYNRIINNFNSYEKQSLAKNCFNYDSIVIDVRFNDSGKKKNEVFPYFVEHILNEIRGADKKERETIIELIKIDTEYVGETLDELKQRLKTVSDNSDSEKRKTIIRNIFDRYVKPILFKIIDNCPYYDFVLDENNLTHIVQNAIKIGEEGSFTNSLLFNIVLRIPKTDPLMKLFGLEGIKKLEKESEIDID